MKKKGALRFVLPVVLVIIILFASVLTSGWYLDKYVKPELESEFNKQTDSSYILKIGSMNISIFGGSISFSDISVLPGNTDPEEATYEVMAQSLQFSGMNFLRFYFNKRIVVDAIELQDPKLAVIRGRNVDVKEEAKEDSFSLYNVIKEFTKSVKVKKIELNNLDLRLYSDADDTVPVLTSNNNQLRIINLYVGEGTKAIPGLFRTDSVMLVLNNISYTTNDSLYTFKASKLALSYTDSLMLVDSLEVNPNFNKKVFAQVAGKQTDRFDIKAEKIRLRHADLRRLVEYYYLIGKNLDITGLTLSAHRDKNMERKPKQPPSLQKLILDAPVYLKIDTVNVTKAFIAYEEVAPEKKEAGRITFNNISANFTGLTNDSLMISPGRELLFKANCMFMDKAPLYATYRIPLSTREMVFECDGYLTSLPMSALNVMLIPTTGYSVESGIIDTLDFNFKAEEDQSNGSMKLIYHDLKVDLPDGNEKTNLKDKIFVFLANNVVLKESNPSGKKEPRIAEMQFERNKQRFMFHYTWQTMLTGIKRSVGVPDLK